MSNKITRKNDWKMCLTDKSPSNQNHFTIRAMTSGNASLRYAIACRLENGKLAFIACSASLVFKMINKSDSGAQKRKNKLEREKRDANLTAKIPKLTNYFGSHKTSEPVEDPACSGSSQLSSPTDTVADLRALHVEEGEIAAAASYYSYNELSPIRMVIVSHENVRCFQHLQGRVD